MGHLCFMLIFDDSVGFRVLTVISSELRQVRQNGQKETCLMKNVLFSIIFAIKIDEIAVCNCFIFVFAVNSTTCMGQKPCQTGKWKDHFHFFNPKKEPDI